MKPQILMFTLLIIALPLCSAAEAEDSQSAVVANVNGEQITYDELVKHALARYGAIALDSLIITQITEQAAAKQGVSVSSEEVDAQYTANERQIELRAPMTGVNFSAWLQMNNLTPFSFRQNIYLSMLLKNMVRDEVMVTDQQVADYYTRNREKLLQPERVNVAHICVSDQQKAEELREKILAGELSFEQAAKDNSLDPWTKDIGGKWGYTVMGKDPFQEAAFALKQDGEISPVVHTKMGYHLIKRLDRQPATIPPFEQVKDKLKLQLERQNLAGLVEHKKMEVFGDAKVEKYIEFTVAGEIKLPEKVE